MEKQQKLPIFVFGFVAVESNSHQWIPVKIE